jgi:GNAT superfamily N-acetyltransferase
MSVPRVSEFVLLTKHKLSSEPPSGFDCRREDQNEFLYESAWPDQRQRVSTTYLYVAGGALVAYTVVCMDAVVLGTREKPAALRYRNIGALKLAQLGVHHAFQGRGVGAVAVGDVIALALELSQQVGCRYVTLDAQPDLVEWYEAIGFKINKVMQKQRVAAATTRNPEEIPVSMRLDLREV